MIRVHVPKHRCRRCSRVFKDSTALGFHHIQSVECDRGEPYPRIAESSTAGYITLEQEEKLRGRVASKRSEGEENKWWAVYHVLFPNDDSTHISPCKPSCQTDMHTSWYPGAMFYLSRKLIADKRLEVYAYLQRRDFVHTSLGHSAQR